MLRIVGTENRATMQAYREGRTLEEYLTEMWQRRQTEHPVAVKSTGRWPCLVYSKPDNVTALKSRKGRGQ